MRNSAAAALVENPVEIGVIAGGLVVGGSVHTKIRAGESLVYQGA